MRVLATMMAGLALTAVITTPSGPVEAAWRESTLTTFEEEQALLADVDARHDTVSVEVAGQTTQGRPINAVLIGPGVQARWRVMYVGAQHGDEVAGREAILELVREYDADPAMLPDGVGLVLVPTMNPDGFVAGTRRNAAGKDLNRDHLFQTQPEVRAMHALQRREMPHLMIDCHEFTRDSSGYGERGWYRWPTIMMGGGNLPMAAGDILAANASLVEQARPLFADDPTAYDEYIVGGVPPYEEQRPSNLEIFDLRNGMAMYGGMSMIIESGRFDKHHLPLADLPVRVGAYLRLLHFGIDMPGREDLAKMVRNARQQPPADVIPTTVMFGALQPRPTTMRVGRLDNDAMVEVESLNVFSTVVHKAFVPRPAAYAIAPEHAEAFRALIANHALQAIELSAPLEVEIEPVEIVAVKAFEDAWDDPSEVSTQARVLAPRTTTLPAGTLLFATDEPVRGMRTCLVLEPMREYGLYGFSPFKELITEPQRLAPVMRVIHLPPSALATEQP